MQKFYSKLNEQYLLLLVTAAFVDFNKIEGGHTLHQETMCLNHQLFVATSYHKMQDSDIDYFFQYKTLECNHTEDNTPPPRPDIFALILPSIKTTGIVIINKFP